MPPINSTPGRPTNRTLLITLTALVLLAVIVLAFALFGTKPPQQPKQQLPGSLVLQVVGTWTTPAGVKTLGTILYTPQTGAVSNNIFSSPGSTTIPAPFTASLLSPDGTHLLAATYARSSTVLGAFSLSTMTMDRTFATAKNGSLFFSPVWSADGTHVAYVDDAQNLQVAGEKSTTKFGSALPLAFSPDNTSLLVIDSSGLERITLATNARTTLTGATPAHASLVKASPDGAYLVLGSSNQSATVYALSGTQFSSIGTIQDAAQIVFGSHDQFLALDSTGTSAKLYTPSPSTLSLTGTYTLPLASNLSLVGWSD